MRCEFDGTVRVLLVDPDREYVEIIRTTLGESYDVSVANTVAGAVSLLRDRTPDVVILDHGLGGSPSALDFANALRRVEPDIALVFTSQSHLSVAEVVRCFQMGADEYIEKPFHPVEFVARVGAVTRRALGSVPAAAGPALEAASAEVQRFELDAEQHRATYAGRALELTNTEFLLLSELHEALGTVVPYERLNGRVLGDRDGEQVTSLKSHVSSLRQKLRTAGARPDILRTARRVGYALAP